jgi:hypothetical protein
MKITGPGRVETTPVKRKNAPATGGGADFALDQGADGGKDSQTSAIAATGPVSSIGALIGLQEVGDEALQSRRKAFSRAEEMLELLEDMRHGLLRGGVSINKINRLLLISRAGHEDFVDPALAQILADIETRAKVELAKIEMSLKGA